MIQGVIEILTDDIGIQNLVGQNIAGNKYKIYPVKAPQKELSPYITVHKLPGAPTQSKQEASTLDICKFRVIGYVKTYALRDQFTEAIRLALDNMTSITDNGIEFEKIWYETDSDGYEERADGEGLYAAIIDFGCTVKRT